jgi:DJ-1 family protein
MARILVVLNPGAEEVEAVSVPDVLVRAGQQVIVASSANAPMVTGSRGIPLGAHTLLDHVLDQVFDVVYLPGGMGSALTHRDDPRIQRLIGQQLDAGRILAVICAAPIALIPGNHAKNRRITSNPGVRSQVEAHCGCWLDEKVVRDGPLVTSQGAGTALALGLELATLTAGPEIARKVAGEMLVPL